MAFIRPPLRWVPRPHFVRIYQVQIPLQVPAGKFENVDEKIAVNVVRVILVLHERPRCKHIGGAGTPQLIRENFKIVDEMGARS
jgi:hypothetical protein